jgi:nucleoside-diphosphate-sugar epimerase
MKILITGGCGFIGTLLTESLIDQNEIIVMDTQWFGNYLKSHKNLKIIKADIRNSNFDFLSGVDTIIHLANIANDPGVELNPSLSWEVNVLSTEIIIKKAIKYGVKHFIYASSGSVYGIKDEPDVTEDLDLLPISIYNKTKMVSERVALSYQNEIKIHIIRPATVCGYSPRMRLDVSVNMFAYQALKNNSMTVFGGNQVRPNIHIKDMVGVYTHFINNSEIHSGCYNAGFENISILDIAKKIKKRIPDSEIKITESNDNRSYRLNSYKLLQTGFQRKYDVESAITDIFKKYETNEIISSDINYTVKWMKKLNLDI